MKIIEIHSYLVHPEKGSEQSSPVRGTKITKEGNMYKMLQGILESAPTECKYSIAFLPKDGVQQNDCRDLVINYIRTPDLETGRELAKHLQSVTTKRSGLGLIFLILGRSDGKSRIVLSRFPAESGVLAEENKQSLSIQFVEKVFMKNANAYKSAFYEGDSFDSDFWKGHAIDKQINSDITISEYWIKEFLLSDFATTGERGTRSLALALRDAVNTTSSIPIKEEITAALILAKGIDGKAISAASFSEIFNLSAEAKDVIKKQMNHKLYEEQFVFLTDEFNKHIKVKTVRLDNGALLSAQTKDFDSIFQRKKNADSKYTFTTTGSVIDEKIKKSNS